MRRLDLTYANRGLRVKTMAVHDVMFHADDVFAAMLIRSIYPELKIIRTRDQDTLDQCDLVADVGFEYDPERLRFDHHQEGRAGARENGVLYSAIGLIWRHWGLDICKGNEEIFEYIDKFLVQPIDAQDNSQELYRERLFDDIDIISLDNIMRKGLNPIQGTDETYDEQFVEAMDFAELIFGRILAHAMRVDESKKDVLGDYSKLKDKRFLVDEEHRPVLAFRREMPELLFYVFPYGQGTDKWILKCAQEEGFTNRKELPKEWAGKNGADLEKVSGIEDMDFCHNALFICGAKNKAAILKALDAALKY